MIELGNPCIQVTQYIPCYRPSPIKAPKHTTAVWYTDVGVLKCQRVGLGMS